MTTTALLTVLVVTIVGAGGPDATWYEKSFYLLHEDHHTTSAFEVGRDADLDATSRLIALSKPDVIQIHAKGNPGWTTYPTKVGHTPPRLARDVLAVWRDIARKDGYTFSVYYNIGRDGEIMKRRPAWNRVRADGKPVDRALCYHSGVAAGYLWPMIREVMAEYRPAGFWFDGSCFTVQVCYCDKCRGRFKRETGLDVPRDVKARGWAAYQEMQRQIYREFVRDTTRMIHEVDPKCLVAVNWAYSLRMPERPDPGIAYLTGDIGNRVEGLSGEAHWYDAQGLPFDLMTQVSTAHKAGEGERPAIRMAPKPREQIEQEMAVIIANGGRYFAWDNPTPESGLVPERLEFLGRVVAPFLRRRQAWCLGSTRVPDVSLLHSAAAHYTTTEQGLACFARADNRIDGATERLAGLHLNYEMIPDWRLERLDVRSPLLIVEHPKVLTKRTVERLIEYVSAGGTLLMTGMGLTRDPRLREVFGIAGCIGPKGAEPLVATVAGQPVRFEHWLFRLETSTASPLLTVRDGAGQTHPFLTSNRFGKGVGLYVAIPLLSRHGRFLPPAPLLRSVLELARPSSARWVSTNAPETVEVVLRQKGDDYVLHLVNMAPGKRTVIKRGRRRLPTVTDVPRVPACRASVRLPSRPTGVHLQPQGVALTGWRFESGRVDLDVPEFGIHQMVVMKVPNRARGRGPND